MKSCIASSDVIEVWFGRRREIYNPFQTPLPERTIRIYIMEGTLVDTMASPPILSVRQLLKF
jgi:hypothetical protein